MTPDAPVVALGETMLSLVTVDGGLADASTMLVTHGGAESNACVWWARLGLPAAWVSALGVDPPGDRILGDLALAGVDVGWVRRDANRSTGLMLRGTTGEPPTYRRAGSAASVMGPEVLQGVPVERAPAVLVTGITAMLGERPAAAATALLERATGLRAVDPNLRLGLWGTGRERQLVGPLLERSDVVLGGEAELAALVGGDERRAIAERCASLGPREVVLKRGSLGAVALADGRWYEVEPTPVADVDPVGAGDAFDAGYVAARLGGASVDEALALGARCGASAASAVGDSAWTPFEGATR